jgi:hypothetical protein
MALDSRPPPPSRMPLTHAPLEDAAHTRPPRGCSMLHEIRMPCAGSTLLARQLDSSPARQLASSTACLLDKSTLLAMPCAGYISVLI